MLNCVESRTVGSQGQKKKQKPRFECFLLPWPARASAMAKPPKKTPNLEWGSMDKGLSVFKTTLQKKLVGGKERNDVPQSFLDQVERVKQLTKLLETLISQAKHCTKAYLGTIGRCSAVVNRKYSNGTDLLPPLYCLLNN